MHKIYFDSNNGSFENGYDLNIEGSRLDIEKITEEIREGMRVIIYMDDDVEFEAILRFDKEINYWVAHPISEYLK